MFQAFERDANFETTPGVENPQVEREEAWDRVRRRLRAELGDDVFSSWFGRLDLVEIVEGVAQLSVPTRFLKSWIQSHYPTGSGRWSPPNAPGVAQINLFVRGASARRSAWPRRSSRTTRRPPSRAPAPARLADAPASASAQAERRSCRRRCGRPAGIAARPRLTFDSFIVGRSNALAHAAAERVARIADRAGHSTTRSIVHAGVGLGKTHLLQAVAPRGDRGPGKRVIYLTADRFMYGFVAALKAQTALAFKERLRGIDLLVIDDVQFIQGKSIQQEFGHTLNALIDAGRQIVDRRGPPAGRSGEPGRARALAPCRRPRGRGQRARTRQLRIDPQHPHRGANAIHHPTSRSARRCRLCGPHDHRQRARSRRRGEPPARPCHALRPADRPLETAETAIRDLVRNREPKRVKIEDIQKLVATHYNVSRADILSERRTAAVVKPRQIAMYLSKVLTLRSLPEIGRRFGGRDHTTVLHAVRKIERRSGEDHAPARRGRAPQAHAPGVIGPRAAPHGPNRPALRGRQAALGLASADRRGMALGPRTG